MDVYHTASMFSQSITTPCLIVREISTGHRTAAGRRQKRYPSRSGTCAQVFLFWQHDMRCQHWTSYNESIASRGRHRRSSPATYFSARAAGLSVPGSSASCVSARSSVARGGTLPASRCHRPTRHNTSGRNIKLIRIGHHSGNTTFSCLGRYQLEGHRLRQSQPISSIANAVSYTHLRAHETEADL
eukprot:1251301-Rhodomonas_salina.3